jgi:hypothetical protein
MKGRFCSTTWTTSTLGDGNGQKEDREKEENDKEGREEKGGQEEATGEEARQEGPEEKGQGGQVGPQEIGPQEKGRDQTQVASRGASGQSTITSPATCVDGSRTFAGAELGRATWRTGGRDTPVAAGRIVGLKALASIRVKLNVDGDGRLRQHDGSRRFTTPVGAGFNGRIDASSCSRSTVVVWTCGLTIQYSGIWAWGWIFAARFVNLTDFIRNKILTR